MTSKEAPVCIGCTRFQGMNDDGDRICISFPDGIPNDIWTGKDPHIVSRNGEEIYQPRDIAHLSYFVLHWVVPALNPALIPRWGNLVRRLMQRNGMIEGGS